MKNNDIIIIDDLEYNKPTEEFEEWYLFELNPQKWNFKSHSIFKQIWLVLAFCVCFPLWVIGIFPLFGFVGPVWRLTHHFFFSKKTKKLT